MAEIKNKPVGRTSDHYKVHRESADRKPDLEPPPKQDVPDFDNTDDPHDEERRRQERGNRGPGEEPGFGQGA